MNILLLLSDSLMCNTLIDIGNGSNNLLGCVVLMVSVFFDAGRFSYEISLKYRIFPVKHLETFLHYTAKKTAGFTFMTLKIYPIVCPRRGT